MRKYEQMANGSLLVHYEGAIGDYALCGHDLDGDSVYGDEWSPAVLTTRRVNCPDCILIQEHVTGKTRMGK